MTQAFDSNIFIFAFDRNSSHHQSAQKLVKEASRDKYNLTLTYQNLIEIYRVITSPKLENPFTPSEAKRELKKLLDRFELVIPNQASIELFLNWAEKFQIVGYRTFDIFLAATLVSHGVEILYTANTNDFKILAGDLMIVNPFEQNRIDKL